MELRKYRLIAFLWTLTILFYLFRAILEPLKYLFLVSSGLLIICYIYYKFSDRKRLGIIKFFLITKEFHIIGFFLVLGILLSSQIETLSVKSFINFLGISTFFFIYYKYKSHISLIKFFKGWIIFTFVIGIIGLVKWLIYFLGFNPDFFSVFYRYGTSLVSDYNFYSSFFLISIVIFYYGLYNDIIHTKFPTNQAIILLFITNIALSTSRRGILILAIFLIIGLFLLILKRKENHSTFYRNLRLTNVLFFSLFIVILAMIPFRSQIVQKQANRDKIASSVYRYSTIIIPYITYGTFYNRLWPIVDIYKNEKTDWEKFATYNNLVNGTIANKYQAPKDIYWSKYKKENNENLIYNGEFHYRFDFWKSDTPDSILHEIISTRYGNAIRVSRLSGVGYWPLAYNGRKIVYYKDATYTFKFKYRLIKGSGVPFMIGWWIKDGGRYINDLPYKITSLGNGWFEYTASYKFINDQSSIPTFMNSQYANTIIDFTDIELTSDDTLARPRYIDEPMLIEEVNLFYNSNFENGLSFWNSEAPDSIGHELIDTKYGNAIRVSRKNGQGYWSLTYQGRDIFYHKNYTYYFRFKFRVSKGVGIPFRIGWWLPKEDLNPFNLVKRVVPLNDGWFECYVMYQFKNNYYGKVMHFMNNQEANTIIDFADIELICNDSLNLPMYADENIHLIRDIEELKTYQDPEIEKPKLLSKRTARWKYALELWQSEYNWPQKFFGGGFDYQRKFGEKFYPEEDRVDYPHNPIISSFLYSGIIGGLFYIYFLVLSFWYYWKFRKHHMLFFILYLIVFVFISISSDSHFNIPIFAMLSLVPFITRYFVAGKDDKSLT